MNNRLELERRADLRTVAGEPVDGAPPAASDPHGSLVLRLRSDDLHIGRDGQSPDAGHIGFKATVVVSSFGGRHYDVTLEAGDLRLQARVADTCTPGEVVTADPAAAAVYNSEGKSVVDSLSLFRSRR